MKTESHKLSVKEKIGYGLGDTASNLYFQMFINFLLFFYTDVFGIPAAVAGTLFVVSRFWDAINDPLMGIVADRTNTKWGKFRPYLIWIMIPIAVIGVFMFSTPDLTIQNKIIYAYITYILMMMAYTAINIPYSALLGVLSPDTQQRTSASTYRFVLAFVGGLIVQGATIPLVYTAGDDSEGYAYSDNILTIQEIDNKTSRIIVTASDNVSESDSEFLINIKRKGENPPTLKQPINDLIFEQGFETKKIDISNVFQDLDGDNLAYEVSSRSKDIIEASLTNNMLILQEEGIGFSELTLLAKDEYSQKSHKFKVYVNAKGNHQPVLVDNKSDITVDIENPQKTINLAESFYDEDGDDLSYSVFSQNSVVVSAEISDNNLILQINEVGISEIFLTANDSKGGFASDTLFVKCQSSENDPPAVYHTLQNIILMEGFKEHTIDLSSAFLDLDGDPLVLSVKKVDVAKGFQYTLIIFGLLACILFFITFVSTKERVLPPQDQQTSLKDDFKDLLRNKPWMILLVMGIFSLAYIIIRVGTIMYYFKYYIENELLASLFMVTGTIAVIAGVALTDYLSRIFGKKKLYIIVMALSTVLTILFYFIPKEQIVLIFIVNIIIQFVMAPQAPLIWAMYADTADYSEWKNKRRATGLVFSAATFAQKFGMALGGGIAGWLLAMFNFQPNVQQTPETLNGIVMMMSFIPAVGSIIATVFAFFYELDEKTMKKIGEDLASRKANSAS
jgi:Na+/melibiose symporter-like transporter